MRWFNKVSRGDWKIGTGLILTDRIPDVICEFAYSPGVYVVSLAADHTGALRYLLQIVLDDFKNSEAEVRGASLTMYRTHSNRTFRRLCSSSSALGLTSTLSLSNRVRVDFIFPFASGDS